MYVLADLLYTIVNQLAYLWTMLTQHIASLTLLSRLFSLSQKVEIIDILPSINNLNK